ncbi:Haem-NO-binding [Desulfocicer vacuolatum DSM 3385]|uniref:Haem-NO-binding n=1 Tax=Desulfocicer vacuolatum DSM 3385 TaxID=1121400 RepID=A0A1W2E8Y3_9BACT|nr:heme NO-binding domain-containing protein [Desulfocicer vacuolatum]SMD06229.1 Haem-NO-binding [Desulfocicer vacuolatum DSM 3385]
MKGLVFTEFIEMVETDFGFEVADRIIENADTSSKGVFTGVGTYPSRDMAALLTQLQMEINQSIPELLRYFGKHLFHRFSKLYEHLLTDVKDTFDLLQRIENFIHVEVKKLYPDARLPAIDAHMISHDTMELMYRSRRKLAHLAHGLIQGCAAYFGEVMEIEMENMLEDASHVRFIIRKV